MAAVPKEMWKKLLSSAREGDTSMQNAIFEQIKKGGGEKMAKQIAMIEKILMEGTPDMQQAIGSTTSKPGLKEALKAAQGKTAAKVAQGATEKGAGIPSIMGKMENMSGAVDEGLTKMLGGGKIGKFVGGNWWWLLPALLGTYLKSKAGQLTENNIQLEHVQKIREGVNPESQFYQAMMLAAQQENQMAQMALMSRLTGQAPQMQLARGEELIGSR